MPHSDIHRSRLDTSVIANGPVQSLVEYHWHQARWDRRELTLLQRFFVRTLQTHPNIEWILTNSFASLSSVPAGTNAPALIAKYLLSSGSTLSESSALTTRLVALYGGGPPHLPASSIIDCIGVALREVTRIAFDLNANSTRRCSNVVTALQKLLFFQSALLRDLFSNTEALVAGAFDETTGLPDYRTILSSLEALLVNRIEVQNPLALMVVRIAVSHLATDASAYAESEVLFAQAADRLKLVLRDTDILGRSSRDEFLIVLPQASGIDLVAQSAANIVEALNEPFDVNGSHALVKSSVGISRFPEHGLEAETLLHHAEIAREEARQSKHHFALYNEEFYLQNRLRQSLEAMLRSALQEDELELYLQPQTDLNTGKIVGAESLLRWRLPEAGLVPPAQIIAVAEESGLISALTMWMFNATLRCCAELVKLGIDIHFSVNVTPSNLADPELADFLSQALKTWDVPANKLIVELTESAMIGDSEGTIDTLHKLKDMGVALSIDDFGTGYSSMAYLKKMPLDELKVDRVFVHNMLSARDDERIVRSVIDLAHHFDLRVVAEGVEDVRTLDFLRKIGCDIAQGFFISKPLPVPDFIDWWNRCDGKLIRN
ncbi:MAG TPA: GGDEF domain-containing phosphodiesterase [Burkholderiales bacterium]|nr:GGDEF domain-containing phosphodiesterase [Burkholderiales bacterium]